MKTRFLAAASAAALSLSLAAAQAPAQDLGLQQLQDSVRLEFAQLGLDLGLVESLTQDELLQIMAVTGTGDSQDVQISRIESILGPDVVDAAKQGDATAVAGETGGADLGGDRVLRENVDNYLAQLGLNDQVKAEALTTEQLVEIQLIQSREISEPEQRERVETLLEIN